MTQEEFEKNVMLTLLESEDEISKSLKEQYLKSSILSREESPVGFFTAFKVPDNVKFKQIDGKIHKVFAQYSDSINDQMFILWITNGKIDTLEGATLGDYWRKDYENAQIVSYVSADERLDISVKENE